MEIYIVSHDDLQKLVDLVWNEATESQEVPDYFWSDEIIENWISDLEGE
jgi:hypothetical protein